MGKGNQFSNLIKYFLMIVLITIYSGCDDSTSPDQGNNDYSNEVELASYPTFGDTRTDFKFRIELEDSSVMIKKIKFDYDSDGEFDDLVYALDETSKANYKSTGEYTVTAKIEFEDGSAVCSTKIYLTDPKGIVDDGNYFFDPSVYTNQMISVTHGVGHRVLLIDLTTYELDYHFEGYGTERFDEMHCSMVSFDGSKLISTNGKDYLFSYYDLETNDTTFIDIPINVDNYPVGQFTWSLDSKSVYCVAENEYNNPDGIKAYNLETKEVTDIYDKGGYICVVPGENDKLAILEKIDDSSSKLIIYNVSTKSIEEEYTNIPFYGPFRKITDTDRIYMDGEMAFYSLSKQKTYYMNFGELGLEHHMYGEADITMDGTEFIIGTYGDERVLYSIELPEFFD